MEKIVSLGFRQVYGRSIVGNMYKLDSLSTQLLKCDTTLPEETEYCFNLQLHVLDSLKRARNFGLVGIVPFFYASRQKTTIFFIVRLSLRDQKH